MEECSRCVVCLSSDQIGFIDLAKQSIRKGLRLLVVNIPLFALEEYFDAVTVNVTSRIIFLPEIDLEVHNQLLDAVTIRADCYRREENDSCVGSPRPEFSHVPHSFAVPQSR